MGQAITGIAGVQRGTAMSCETAHRYETCDRVHGSPSITDQPARGAQRAQPAGAGRHARRARGACANDDDVRLVVFTGAGEKAFVAGADIAQVRTLHPAHRARRGDAAASSTTSRPSRSRPSPPSTGSPSAAAASWRWPATSGSRRHRPFRAAGDQPVGAARRGRHPAAGPARRHRPGDRDDPHRAARRRRRGAARSGWSPRWSRPSGLLRRDRAAVADQILAKGPLAVRLAKLVVRAGMDADQRTGQVVERLAQALLYTTDDKAEGAERVPGEARARLPGDGDRR